MALPANIDPSSPLIGDQITAGAAQIRDFKLFLADILGIPISPSNVSQPILNASVPGAINHAVGTGSANAHIAIFNPPFTSLVDGMEISFKPVATNTGVTNFQLDTLANTVVQKRFNGSLVGLVSGDIIQNERATLSYYAAGPSWILENPTVTLGVGVSNVFTVDQEIASSFPSLFLRETDQALNSKLFAVRAEGAKLQLIALNDDKTNPVVVVEWDRVGTMLSGFVPDARLTSNIPLLDVVNEFTASVITVSGTAPSIYLKENDTVGKNSLFVVDASKIQLQQRDDAFNFINNTVAWDIATKTQTDGNVPLLRLSRDVGGAVFDSADKMIAGTVPLNRVGISGSFTTGIININPPEIHTITHGLGTDNVQIFMIIASNAPYRMAGIRPDGAFFPDTDLLGFIAPPSSGSISIVVIATNSSFTVNGALVRYTILRED